MQPNMGTTDRVIRAIVGIAAISSWPLGLVEGSLGVIVLVVGAVLLGTALIRWCPPYDLLGINTGADKN